MTPIRIVILAGGKGKRLGAGEAPKALTLLKGKPMIQHLLDAVEESGIDPRPVILIGQGAEHVQEVLGEGYQYVFQEKQLGTGHALKCTAPFLKGKTRDIMVLYCDHPFVHQSTLKKLRVLHEREGRMLTMLTTVVQDFEGWRAPFADFGRVLRNAGGEVVRIIEKKEATAKQLTIREVNPALYCFDAAWLFLHLPKIKNMNVQGEYYLTDLVRIAIQEGERVASMDIDPFETIGVNTPEHLELAGKLL